MSGERVKVVDYWKVRRDINEVGLDELRRFVRKHHPRAVNYIDRQLNIVKATLANGPNAAAKMYECCTATCTNIVTKWWGYAQEVLKEREEKE